MIDILTYLDNHNEDERKLFFLYKKNYSAFVKWANNHNIDLTLKDPEFSDISSLLLWVDCMEEY